MKVFRRLFGASSNSMGRSSGRAAHVTPAFDRSDAAVNEAPATTVAPGPDAAPASDGKAPPATPVTPAAIAKAPGPLPAPVVDAPARGMFERPAAPGLDATPAAPMPRTARRSMTYGIASDLGRQRDNNEDACFAMQWQAITVDDKPEAGLFALADGMGGHLDGEKAARIAVQTLAAEAIETIVAPMLRDAGAADGKTLLEALVAAAEAANRAVIKDVPGGGTTLSCVVLVGNLAYLIHVGDSRAYLIQDERIEQLTTDHTLVQRLVEMKELTPEEAEYYPQKNVLYRAIGQNEELKIERMIRKASRAAQILICSDGLWDQVDDETLLRVAQAAPTAQDACDQLVSLANEAGGGDNISVILVRIPKVAEADPAGISPRKQ